VECAGFPQFQAFIGFDQHNVNSLYAEASLQKLISKGNIRAETRITYSFLKASWPAGRVALYGVLQTGSLADAAKPPIIFSERRRR
jgi:hypothetical protein